MIVAWFRSPPGEASRTMSPAARLAWSSLSRNQFAAAGPIVPLTNSARRPSRLGEPSRSELVDHLRCQARRDVLVLPVVPGLRLRQVAVGANADAGDQQDEDGDRPEMPLAAGRLHRRWRAADRPACAAARPRGRSATCGSDFPRPGCLRSTIDPRSQAEPVRGIGLVRNRIIRIYGRGYGGDASLSKWTAASRPSLMNGGGALGRSRLGAGLARGRCGS